MGVNVQHIQELIQLNLKKTNNLIMFGHKNGQSVGIDILPKKTHKLQRGTEKMFNITNYQGKANQNHNIISLPSKWHLSQRQQIISVDKDVEKT